DDRTAFIREVVADTESRGAQRAAQVIAAAGGLGVATGNNANHLQDHAVARHGTADHVAEYGHNLGVEGKALNGLPRCGVNLVAAWRVAHFSLEVQRGRAL